MVVVTKKPTSKAVPEGYKRTEVGLIPEDWEVKFLGELINYTKGYAFKSSDYETSGVRIVKVSDIRKSSNDNDPAYIPSDIAHKYSKWELKKDDLVVTTVGSKPPLYDSIVGKSIYIDNNFEGSLLNQNAVKLESVQGDPSLQFLIHSNLGTKRYFNHIEEIYRGNANQASITLDGLFKFQIPLPPTLEEQQAIAESISNVDALIAELDALIEKKQQVKKGTMQQLLTGKKRLPGFNGEWDDVLFNDAFNKLATKSFQIPSSKYNTSGKYPVVDQGKKKITGYSSDESKVFSCPEEGVIIFGDHTREVKYVDFDFVIGADGTQLLLPTDSFFARYLFYQLKTKDIPNTGYNRHFKYLKEMSFKRPAIEEQKAIAGILSDMDAEIQALQTKRSKYEKIKQGIMQELLTGKTRLV